MGLFPLDMAQRGAGRGCPELGRGCTLQCPRAAPAPFPASSPTWQELRLCPMMFSANLETNLSRCAIWVVSKGNPGMFDSGPCVFIQVLKPLSTLSTIHTPAVGAQSPFMG